MCSLFCSLWFVTFRILHFAIANSIAVSLLHMCDLLFQVHLCLSLIVKKKNSDMMNSKRHIQDEWTLIFEDSPTSPFFFFPHRIQKFDTSNLCLSRKHGTNKAFEVHATTVTDPPFSPTMWANFVVTKMWMTNYKI